MTFAKGEVVMREGSHYHRIYQIARGTCRIEQSRKDGSGPGLTNSAPEENAAAAAAPAATGAAPATVRCAVSHACVGFFLLTYAAHRRNERRMAAGSGCTRARQSRS
jgi:hypothetical protein